MKESRENIIKFLKEIPSRILVLLDKNGKVNKLFGVWAHPTTFVVDRRGIVRYRAMGVVDWTGPEAKEVLDRLVKEK
jgi:peroxiredoxin